MELNKLIKEDTIIKINSANLDYLQVLEEIANNLLENNLVYDTFSNAVIEREKIYPTGLDLSSIGIAIPHTDTEFVRETSVGMGILSNEVLFNSMGVTNLIKSL